MGYHRDEGETDSSDRSAHVRNPPGERRVKWGSVTVVGGGTRRICDFPQPRLELLPKRQWPSGVVSDPRLEKLSFGHRTPGMTEELLAYLDPDEWSAVQQALGRYIANFQLHQLGALTAPAYEKVFLKSRNGWLVFKAYDGAVTAILDHEGPTPGAIDVGRFTLFIPVPEAGGRSAAETLDACDQTIAAVPDTDWEDSEEITDNANSHLPYGRWRKTLKGNRPKFPDYLWNSGTTRVEQRDTIIRVQGRSSRIPHFGPADIRNFYPATGRVFIVDSGASSDVMHDQMARDHLSPFVSKTFKVLRFSTVGSEERTEDALRGRVAVWDGVTDWTMMNNTPELLSQGLRCVKMGFTYIHVDAKFPCYLSPSCRYIIIFDLDGVLPIWHPGLEAPGSAFGCRELALNHFLEMTGIYINDYGEICIRPSDVSGISSHRYKKRRWGNVAQSDPPVAARDASTQTTEEAVGPTFDKVGTAAPHWNDDFSSVPTFTPNVDIDDDAPLSDLVPDSGTVGHPRGADVPEASRAPSEFYKSRQHLLDHKVFIPGCPGCQAKARGKKHFKKAFERDDGNHEHMITMYQVSMADKQGHLGIGGFRYGIVMVHLTSDYWRFIPLKPCKGMKPTPLFVLFVVRRRRTWRYCWYIVMLTDRLFRFAIDIICW